MYSSSAVYFSDFRAINCNRNDTILSMSNSVQYFACKSCKFAGFLCVKMHVAQLLVGRMLMVNCVHCVSFRFPQLWPDASRLDFRICIPYPHAGRSASFVVVVNALGRDGAEKARNYEQAGSVTALAGLEISTTYRVRKCN